jgi:hypothetical protein
LSTSSDKFQIFCAIFLDKMNYILSVLLSPEPVVTG